MVHDHRGRDPVAAAQLRRPELGLRASTCSGRCTCSGPSARSCAGRWARRPRHGAQKYGYLKDYRYDTRFKDIQPPYFLKPAANLWQVLTVTDK